MPKDLSSFFYPKSVCVIGASRSPEKVGAIILKNIINSGYKGKIYPVNPNTDLIDNLKCHPDVLSLPEIPELVVIAIPAEGVLGVTNQLGEKGVKNVIVISAGFKEVGGDGEKLENDLIEVAKRYELNLLGPNCMGFVNNLCFLNVTFGEPVNESGNIRFISQSGALAASIFDWCNSNGFGFSQFVTLGNKAVLNENDILEFLHLQSENSLYPANVQGLSKVFPIGLYLESISNGPEFLKIISNISKKDPILVIKPGKTKAASDAMKSHTGSIAGEDDVLDAALKQSGVIRCETLQDFFDLSRAFAWEDIPSGPNVAIISNAGGPSVISADAVVKEGLELTKFDDETNRRLLEILPRVASIMNPVDVLGDALADRYAQASEIIIQKENVNALIVILTPQIMTQVEKTAEIIGNLSNKYKKPIFCSFIGGRLVAEGEKILNKCKIPSFRFPEQAIKTVGAMYNFKKQRDERSALEASKKQSQINIDFDKTKEILKKAAESSQKVLDNIQSNEILSSCGINTPETKVISSLNEAIGFTQDYGWPVVLKLSSPHLLHKTDIGGVIKDIGNENYLEIAWDKLERRINELDENIKKDVKIQIQKEILDGIEVIVGARVDPVFGPVLLFGAGGTLAELIADKNLYLLPVGMSEAEDLVKRSKVFTLLKGHRGELSYAYEKIYEVIVRLGKIIEANPEISDIEINPAIVTLNSVWAVDGKIILKSGEVKPVTIPQFKVASTLAHINLVSKYHVFTFETQEPLVFKPGQYITVRVATNIVRCYSIASSDGTNKFNLLVDTTPGGPGSKFFENLQVGDRIAYVGPFGTFTLNLDDGAKHLLFLATGSGCAPLRRMIDAALKEENSKLPMTLYFGFRSSGDVFWEDYFWELSKKYPNFTFKLAADKADKTWKGHVGFITDLVKKDFPDASECAAYLCGSKPMVENATKILLELGCPSERIYTEKV